MKGSEELCMKGQNRWDEGLKVFGMKGSKTLFQRLGMKGSKSLGVKGSKALFQDLG